MATINITDILLNEIAQHFEDKNQYFTVGSGDTATSGDQNDLEFGIAVNSGDPVNRNKLVESGTISNNMVVMTYRLTSLQPSGIPVTLKEIGTFESITDENDLKTRFVLPTGETKDNLSEWVIRLTTTILESGSS